MSGATKAKRTSSIEGRRASMKIRRLSMCFEFLAAAKLVRRGLEVTTCGNSCLQFNFLKLHPVSRWNGKNYLNQTTVGNIVN